MSILTDYVGYCPIVKWLPPQWYIFGGFRYVGVEVFCGSNFVYPGMNGLTV